MGDSPTPMDWKANVIGNYFICPPGNIRNTPLEKAGLDRDGKPNFSVHVANNLHDNNGDEKLNGKDRGWDIVGGSPFKAGSKPPGNYIRLDAALPGSKLLAIDEPLTAYKKIVSDSGPLRFDLSYAGTLRDEVDTRLMENLVNLKRGHITRESDLKGVTNNGFGTFKEAAALPDDDADGMPDVYEDALRWDSKEQDHNKDRTFKQIFLTVPIVRSMSCERSY